MKRKYTVKFDSAKNKWILQHAGSNKVLRTFNTKEAATRAGVLRKTIGPQGGSVTIRTRTGTFEEERIFPGS